MKVLSKKGKFAVIHWTLRASAYTSLLMLVKLADHSPLKWISWYWVFSPFIILISAWIIMALFIFLVLYMEAKVKQEDDKNEPPVPPSFIY